VSIGDTPAVMHTINRTDSHSTKELWARIVLFTLRWVLIVILCVHLRLSPKYEWKCSNANVHLTLDSTFYSTNSNDTSALKLIVSTPTKTTHSTTSPTISSVLPLSISLSTSLCYDSQLCGDATPTWSAVASLWHL